MITGLLAHCTVTDLGQAENWYTRLFDRGPDARPMAGLMEWHLGDGFGVQVWSEPARAGRSCVVLQEGNLDASAERLASSGIAHDGPQPGGGARILQLADPDGNRVVLVGQ